MRVNQCITDYCVIGQIDVKSLLLFQGSSALRRHRLSRY